MAAARAYLLTGDRVRAAEAHRLGLVHRVVPRTEVLPVATALAERIAALPAFAVRETKRCLDAHVTAAAQVVFERALAGEDQSFDTAEHRAAVEVLHRRRDTT